MYSSLQQKYERAMAQLRRFQEQKDGAIKVPANQFANGVDDDSKSASNVLLFKLGLLHLRVDGSFVVVQSS